MPSSRNRPAIFMGLTQSEARHWDLNAEETMIESREQLLAKADECERLAQLAGTDQLRRRNAVLALYWVALAGATADQAPRRMVNLDEAA
jgi:hypothetical protein